MKKSYIQPHSFEVSLHTEGMIAASVGFGNTEYDGSESLTNKKDGEYWSTGMEGGEDYFESQW